MSKCSINTWEADWQRDLARQRDNGLLRRLRGFAGPQGRVLDLDGRRVLNFCSNDYLGLAADPRLKEAAAAAMAAEGFGTGASRLVCGNFRSHQRLEERLAAWKGTEACVVFSTGYMANVGILSALCARRDLVFSDRRNHASIIDGVRLSGADLRRYPHRDVAALSEALRGADAQRRKVLVSDSVFSMDGDIAPLRELAGLADEFGCLLMVDEAHALGVLGEQGKGAVEQCGLEGRVPVQMGTLSKAVGAFGAYCCGSRVMVDTLIHSARSLIYTTGLPPAVAAAALEGIEIIAREPERRRKLWQLTEFVRGELRRAGFDTLASVTPIIPIVVSDDRLAKEFSARLLERGILIAAIRPPTVPAGTARLRLTVTAAHEPGDCERVLEQIIEIGRELCLI